MQKKKRFKKAEKKQERKKEKNIYRQLESESLDEDGEQREEIIT